MGYFFKRYRKYVFIAPKTKSSTASGFSFSWHGSFFKIRCREHPYQAILQIPFASCNLKYKTSNKSLLTFRRILSDRHTPFKCMGDKGTARWKKSDVYAHLPRTTIESKGLGVQRMQTRPQEPKKSGPILRIETNPPTIFINAMGSPREDRYLLTTATWSWVHSWPYLAIWLRTCIR